MPTPVSTATSYCSGSDFLVWYDVRTVGEALSDDNVTIAPDQVPANAKLEKILLQASGKVEAATLLGKKYTLADLAALTGASKAFLQGLVADLAAPKVIGRRFTEFPDYVARLQEAEGVLSALAKGEIIFGLQDQIDAGIQDNQNETPTDVEKRALATWNARRMYGRRNNQIWPGPVSNNSGLGS